MAVEEQKLQNENGVWRAYVLMSLPIGAANAQLMEKVDQALDRRWLKAEPDLSADALREKYAFDDIIGQPSSSSSMTTNTTTPPKTPRSCPNSGSSRTLQALSLLPRSTRSRPRSTSPPLRARLWRASPKPV